MPDPISRKRLKKKMLDRWENEGGRVVADPADAARPAREHGVKQPASRKTATAATSTKKRKSTRK